MALVQKVEKSLQTFKISNGTVSYKGLRNSFSGIEAIRDPRTSGQAFICTILRRHTQRYSQLGSGNFDDPQVDPHVAQNYRPFRHHLRPYSGQSRPRQEERKNLFFNNPSSGLRVGHRGLSRLPWRRGPREPSAPHGGYSLKGPFSLFVDGIPRHLPPHKLRVIFEQVRTVVDVFISKKSRKSTKDAFGFVRFRTLDDAETAMRKIDGFSVLGKNQKVSFARYNRNGSMFENNPNICDQLRTTHRRIQNPSFRDSRKYRDVVMGVKQRPPPSDQVTNTIPILFSINVDESLDMATKLKHAIIAECSNGLDLSKVDSFINQSGLPVMGLHTLSTTKILMSFESVEESEMAIKEDSVLWQFFDDIRMWSDGESFDDRLIWLDCFGIHPKVWSLDTIRNIGERWGPVITIDQNHHNISSVTHARILVRTKAQNRVDGRVRLLFEHGSCEIWVKEVGHQVQWQKGNDELLEGRDVVSTQWVCETENISCGRKFFDNDSEMMMVNRDG